MAARLPQTEELVNSNLRVCKHQTQELVNPKSLNLRVCTHQTPE